MVARLRQGGAVTRTRKPAPAALARQFAEWLASQQDPANDAEPIDEESLRELARQDAEQMRRARKR